MHCISTFPTVLLALDPIYLKKIILCIYVFIFGCAGSSLLDGLSLVAARGSYSLVVVCGLLIAVASLVAQALGYSGFSRCSTGVQ